MTQKKSKIPNFPEADCKLGYSMVQLQLIMDRQKFIQFSRWMHGQTMAICEGRHFDFDSQTWVHGEEDCDTSHGVVAYRGDVYRFLHGLPVID